MAGKQAKILTDLQLESCLNFVDLGRYGLRNVVMVLLSSKAGLRAGEISALTWSMVLDATGKIGQVIELEDCAAKKRSGRTIPLHPDLRKALVKLRNAMPEPCDFVIHSERGGGMTAGAVVNWFGQVYRDLGFTGCTSHSGRRTFITNAARRVHKAGGSLRDVQELAGHRSIVMTQRYIEGDTEAKRRLVSLL